MSMPRPAVAAIRALSGVPRDRLPAFLGIGAQKAGTTWLFENLRRHPELFLSPAKELHYFDRGYAAPLAHYAARFRAARARVSGEITPAYGSLPRERIRFIAAVMPDVRLVLVLRNPIDRAWSQAVMELARRRGRPVQSLRRREVIAFFRSELSISRSRYIPMLDSWLESFAEEQLLVGFFEDIERRPRQLLRTVFRHLGVATRVDWQAFPYDRPIVPNLRGGLRPGRFGRVVSARTAGHDQSPPCPPWAVEWLWRRHEVEIRELERRFGDRVRGWRAAPCRTRQ